MTATSPTAVAAEALSILTASEPMNLTGALAHLSTIYSESLACAAFSAFASGWSSRELATLAARHQTGAAPPDKRAPLKMGAQGLREWLNKTAAETVSMLHGKGAEAVFLGLNVLTTARDRFRRETGEDVDTLELQLALALASAWTEAVASSAPSSKP